MLTFALDVTGGSVSYAIIRSGGLQYRVSEGDTIRVPRMREEVGRAVKVDDVLAVSREGRLTVGRPLVDGVSVSAEIVGHGRGKKVIVFKKKRRKGYQVKKGHRQDYTELRILGIGS
jgi:large subunit ribosomal protein L21